MFFSELLEQICNLKQTDLENITIKLDQKAKKIGFFHLSAEDRFLLVQGIRFLSETFVNKLTFCESNTKKSLIMLKEKGMNSYSKVFSIVSEPFIHLDNFSELNREPISEGPVAIFIANVGAQVPVAKQTLGNKSRGYIGVQPPLGQYYIASYLNLLGVETYVFNLALGDNEKRELEEKIMSLKKRLWFVSFSSSFLGEEELDTVYYLANILEVLKKDGIYPRLVGGGMGVYFSKDTYLHHTPMEMIIGRYGEPSFGDMIFASGYRGPYDSRENVSLFGHIPNLYIKSTDGAGIYQTKKIPLSLADRRVIANSLDITKVPFEKKYWLKNIMMGICAPDDLNISLDLLQRDGLKDKEIRLPSVEMSDLHPSNYVFKPKTIKVMSTFGNCQRGCKFCQFTHYDESLYLMPVKEVVAQLNNIVKVYPDVHMFVFDDDDFMSRGKYIWELIETLKENKPTQGKVFYIETIPTSLKYEVLSPLWEAGFRAILFGIESHSEKIVYDTKKLKQGESFKQFIEAPKIAYNEGFFTRVTGIMFYPIATIEDIVQNIKGFTEYIMHGITVTIFPFVQALPGNDFVNEKKNKFYKTYYRVKNEKEEYTIELPQYILPDDPFINKIAFKSIKYTPTKLYELLTKYNITTDYPMSLGVLAFFKSIIQSSIEMANSLEIKYSLEEIDVSVEKAINMLVKKHFVQLSLQRTLKCLTDEESLTACKIIEKFLEEDTISHVISGLRMFLYFGDNDEVTCVARLLAILTKFGIYDKYLTKGLELYCKKESLSQEQKKIIAKTVERLQ